MESLEFLGGRYNRPEQIMSGSVQAFRAQNAATGRAVFIHRVSTTEAPQEQASLLKLLTTALVKSNDAKRLVLDFGEERGYWYVVTESEPQCALLREWLQLEIDTALANSGKPPSLKAEPFPMHSAQPPAPMRKPEDSGEFTRFLQKTRSPLTPPPPSSPRVDPPSMRVSPTPVPPISVPPPPGEFTRTFQSEEKPLPLAPPSSPPAASVPPPVQRPPAGEFTQLFNKLGTESKEAAPPPAAPVPPGSPHPVAPAHTESQPEPSAPSGEFTRFFSGGVPPSPPKPNPYVQRPNRAVPPVTPISATPPATPAPGGEFTRFFSGDAPAPDQPAAPPPVQRPTTRTPPPAPLPPTSPKEGEFTRMFARSPESGRPSAPVADPFRNPKDPFGGVDQNADDLFGGGERIDIPPPPPSQSQQHGEFTRMFGGGGDASPAIQRPSVVAAPKPVSPVNDQPFSGFEPPVSHSAPPPQPEETGPSEFTRIMRGGANPAPPSSAAPPSGSAAGTPSSIPLPKIPLPGVSAAPPNPGASLGHLSGGTGSAHASASSSGASASANSALGSAQFSAPAPALPKPAIPAAKLPVPAPLPNNRKIIILFAVLGLLAVLLVLLTLFLIKK